ncbi:MAG: hypothetical protein JO079_00510 [Frankiaceae bacterium]|nr:hypothetical protein [Frankiaceae bacterium]
MPEGENQRRTAVRASATKRKTPSFEREIFEPHAPPGWPANEILGAARKKEPHWAVVMAVDIRKSTILMREAVDFTEFADAIGTFVDHAKEEVRKADGWFDKFTGDGFLAYWVFDEAADEDDPLIEAANPALDLAADLISYFNRISLPKFRANSRNLPRRIGMSAGLDAGQVYFANIGGDLTIVGPAVVGAVRMVTAAATPGETVANVFLGEYLLRRRDSVTKAVTEIQRDYCATKEYDEQEIYRISVSSSAGVVGRLVSRASAGTARHKGT